MHFSNFNNKNKNNNKYGWRSDATLLCYIEKKIFYLKLLSYFVNFNLFVEIIQYWNFFFPHFVHGTHFLGVEKSFFRKAHGSTITQTGRTYRSTAGSKKNNYYFK